MAFFIGDFSGNQDEDDDSTMVDFLSSDESQPGNCVSCDRPLPSDAGHGDALCEDCAKKMKSE